MRAPLFPVTVAGPSMIPVLAPGDVCVVRRNAAIQPGDIVVARRPDAEGMLVVKRAVRREPDGWWLESDNDVDKTRDSRHYGVVPDEHIVGRVVWPKRARRR